MRTLFLVTLVLIASISVGFLVFSLANMYYRAPQLVLGPYNYNIIFGEGIRAKDLGIIVHLNLSGIDKGWFVGEEKNVVLEISAEKIDNFVQNFSWKIFWIKLYALKDGNWKCVAHGSSFLNGDMWSNSRLYKRQNISVVTVNMNYFESVYKAWFKIGIMIGYILQ